MVLMLWMQRVLVVGGSPASATMCIRSWMKAGVIKIPADRQKAMLSLKARFPDAAIDEVVNTMEAVEQEEWVEEVLDDSALGMLNTQFNQVFAEEFDS